MSDLNKLVIAIDGHASCGKSTLARLLSENLGYTYIDTGAMYRTVTLHFHRIGLQDLNNSVAVEEALSAMKIDLNYNSEGIQEAYLNGENVEEQIRQPEITAQVSAVSAIKEVRESMVAQQQEMGKKGGIVMDGRDIGTVVFPDADLKIFLTAAPEVRAVRRQKELEQKGTQVTVEEVLAQLSERDLLDSTRKESPLRRADDAIELDNSDLTPMEQVETILVWVKEKQMKAV